MGYSYSRLKTYRDCPLRYKFTYIDKIKAPGAIEQFIGSMVHEALEEVLKVRWGSNKDLSCADACRIFDERFDEHLTDDLLLRNTNLTVEDHRARGHDFIARFYLIEAQREQGEVLGVEKWIAFPIGSSSMGGFIDRLERRGDDYHIIDYKASYYPMTQAKANADWQLPIYEMAVRKEYPDAQSVLLEWFYLGPGIVVQSARTAEQLKELEGEICALIDAIESDAEFLPLGNNWCPCEHEDRCKADKQRRRIKA